MKPMNQRATWLSRYARPIAWILGAFGLLAAGMLAGALAPKEWDRAFAIAGFVAYVWAFRRGLLIWKPEIDDLWCVRRSTRKREPEEAAPSPPRPGRGGRFGSVTRFPGSNNDPKSKRSAASVR